MTDYQQIISETNGWLGKGGLPILEDIVQAIESPWQWFQNLSGIHSLLEDDSNFPTLTNSLRFYDRSTMEATISKSANSFLHSAYGVNKAYNSLRHRNLQATGENIAARTRMTNRDKANYKYAVQAHDFYLNCPDLQRRFQENPYQGRLADIESRLRMMQDENRDWLQKIFDAASNAIDGLQGSLRTKARRVANRISKILGREVLQVNFVTIDESELIVQSRFTGVAEPTAMQAIGAISNVAAPIVKDFLIVPAMPGLGVSASTSVGAIVNTTSGVVSKNIAFTGGAEISRYFAGQGLRQSVSVLPNLWNATGTFTGAWGFLIAAAPYIILAAVIVTAAIEMSKKTDVGNNIFILARTNSTNDFDLTYAAYPANTPKENLLPKFLELKQDLYNQTGKEYSEVYAFSLNNNDEHKLALNMSSPTPLPMPEDQAKQLWELLSDSEIFELFRD